MTVGQATVPMAVRHIGLIPQFLYVLAVSRAVPSVELVMKGGLSCSVIRSVQETGTALVVCG